MNKTMPSVTALSILLVLLGGQALFSKSPVFQYVSPKPGSILVSEGTNIILRNGSTIDPSSLKADLIRIQGSRSGMHTGDLILSDDGRTIVFNPHEPFSGSEVVHVSVQAGIKTTPGASLPAYAFNFTIMPQTARPLAKPINEAFLPGFNSASQTLPAPPIKIDSVNNPSPGCIFLATWDRNVPKPNYANFIFVLDSSGHVLDSLRINGPASDFKILSNGLLSYSRASFSGIVPSGAGWTYYVMDNAFTVLDSFKMKNGYYSTDGHEFQLLPNGHALLMSYLPVTYDMSKIVPDGKTDAAFTICVLQEQDVDKNVVFEWRDIDHVPITDTDVALNAAAINYTTLNAFTLDQDGNFLVSSRTLSTILKISRTDGEILWRLGGKKSDFKFIGEHPENAPYYFARQHHISRLQNGHITLFDNGDFHTPPYSRAVEYSLDEVNKSATLVSEYRYPSANIFSLNGGAAVRLPDGGWFMGFGNLSPQSPVKRIVVEAHADGSTALELSVPNNVTTYRIAKQLWKKGVSMPSVTVPEVHERNTYSFNKAGHKTGVSITYTQMGGDLYNMATVTRIPYGPIKPEFIEMGLLVSPVSIRYEGSSIYSQKSEFQIDLAVYPEVKHPQRTSLYAREFAGHGLFVKLSTTYDSTGNKLTATMKSFGEIIFGEPDVRQGNAAPVLNEPFNKKKTLASNPVTLKWTGSGLFESFQLQTAKDSLFSAIQLDTTLMNSYFTVSNLVRNQKYHWRVRAENGSGTTAWSSIWSFQPTDAFIKISTPNGGESFQLGVTTVVRWDTNVADSIKVNLVQGTGKTLLGRTSAGNCAFSWAISKSLNPGSSNKLSLVTYRDSTIAGMSEAAFSITAASGIDQADGMAPGSHRLFQNFPNPFNPETHIAFALPKTEFVTLKVYDMLGREIETLVSGIRGAGSHSCVWNSRTRTSGMYFFRLETPSFSQMRKMVLMK